MAYEIKRRSLWVWWRPWTYWLMLSSYGAVAGRAWTKRGAENALMRAQSEWFSEH